MNHAYIPAFTLEPLKREVRPNEPVAVRTPRFIDDVAAGRVELPTIPRVVQQVIAALRDPDADSRRIAGALSQDPILSAKVLRVANSAHYGSQRSMTSIEAAVARIGTQGLSRLIVACGVSGSFKQIAAIDLRIFWRDALVAATAANKLAPHLSADPEEAYLCGLLHAAGHLILCQSYPDIANAMFAGFEVVRGPELAAIELEAFGIDHPHVGALWVQTLGFAPAVGVTIGKSIQPPADSDSPLDLVLRSACVLAAAVARKSAADAALTVLPTSVRSRCTAPGGEPTAEFGKLYDTLLQTKPMA